MPAPVTTHSVWSAIEDQLFAVLGFVTPKGEARTAGICYVVSDMKLYIATDRDSWKAKYVAKNPNVSLTVPIAKRIPFVPWVHIPQATITFNGVAELVEIQEMPEGARRRLLRANAEKPDTPLDLVVMIVRPKGDFITYGIDIPLHKMPDKELARGRAAVA